MTPDLERDLVAECQRIAAAMNAYVMVVGQRRAKGSGTTTGYPDMTLVCSGQVRLIELKRPKLGCLSLGQIAVIEKCAEQGVTVHVVDSAEDFIGIVNECRRAPTFRVRV